MVSVSIVALGAVTLKLGERQAVQKFMEQQRYYAEPSSSQAFGRGLKGKDRPRMGIFFFNIYIYFDYFPKHLLLAVFNGHIPLAKWNMMMRCTGSPFMGIRADVRTVHASYHCIVFPGLHSLIILEFVMSFQAVE